LGIFPALTTASHGSWQATLSHIAGEGRCFGPGCNQYVIRKMYPAELQPELTGQPEVICRGGGAIF